MTEEEAHHQARVATAQEFGIHLWVVEVNEICLEKDIEWFHLYS